MTNNEVYPVIFFHFVLIVFGVSTYKFLSSRDNKKMFNGVGLATTKGVGMSGFIERSKAFGAIRSQYSFAYDQQQRQKQRAQATQQALTPEEEARQYVAKVTSRNELRSCLLEMEAFERRRKIWLEVCELREQLERKAQECLQRNEAVPEDLTPLRIEERVRTVEVSRLLALTDELAEQQRLREEGKKQQQQQASSNAAAVVGGKRPRTEQPSSSSGEPTRSRSKFEAFAAAIDEVNAKERGLRRNQQREDQKELADDDVAVFAPVEGASFDRDFQERKKQQQIRSARIEEQRRVARQVARKVDQTE